MNRKTALAWLALAATAGWWLTQWWRRHPDLDAEFDDEGFYRQAIALAARERRIASAMLTRARDDGLRDLARMILAQHHAEDGLWKRWEADTASGVDEDPAHPSAGQPGLDTDAGHAALLEQWLDEAWPLFDEASQRSGDADVRDWAARVMAWLEESGQTLHVLEERLHGASAEDGRPLPSPGGVC